MLQFITIDTSILTSLGANSPLEAAWRIFVIGGWIPVTYIILLGLFKAWMLYRQNLYGQKFPTTLLAIDVPKENEQLPKAVENIFSHIFGSYAFMDRIEKYWVGKIQPVFSLEVCSHGGYVQFYIRTQVRFRDLVESAIFSQYPEAEITEVDDYTKSYSKLRFPHPDYDMFGTEFILGFPNYLPLRTYLEFEEKLAGEFKDPIGILLESLSKIRPEEQVWIQILIAPADFTWKKPGEAFIKKTAGIKETPKQALAAKIVGAPLSIASEVLTHGGVLPAAETKKKDDNSMFRMLLLTPDIKTVLDSVANKISKAAFSSKIRVLYLAPKKIKSTGRVFSTIKGSFAQFSGLNFLKGYLRVSTKEDYFWERMVVNKKKNRILLRYINRSMQGAPLSVLNIEELATLYHFPISTVKAPLIKKTESRRAEPPAGLPMSRHLPGQEAGEELPHAHKRDKTPGIPFVP